MKKHKKRGQDRLRNERLQKIILVIAIVVICGILIYSFYSEPVGQASKYLRTKVLQKQLTYSQPTVPTPAPAPPSPTPVPVPTVSAGPRCTDVIINGLPEEKINVIFIGINYSNSSLFEKHVNLDIDWNGQSYGLFSIEPYKTYREQFNFYRIDNSNATFDCLGRGIGDACGSTPYDNIRIFMKSVCGQKLFGNGSSAGIIEEPFIEVLINEPAQGSSGFSPIGQRVSLMWSSRTSENPTYAMTFTHEFGGHALAGLQDEYVGTIKEPTQTYCTHPYCQQFLQAIGYSGERPEEQAPNCDMAGCAKWANLIGQEGIGCSYFCGGYEDLYHPTKCQMIVDKDGDPVRKTVIGTDGKKYMMRCNIMDGPTSFVNGVNRFGKKWSIDPKDIEKYTYRYFDSVAQIAIKKQIQRLIRFPICNKSEPECAKAHALFGTLMPLRTDPSTGTIIQGAYDKNKEFTVHQFAVIYDTLVMLPENVRSALKILMFSRDDLGQPWVAHPDKGSFYIAYDMSGTYRNWSNDRVLSCLLVHEIGHLVEESAGILKPFRSICFEFVNGAWQQKPECEVYQDFAPQITFRSSENHNEWIWSNELRARSAGADGREDIANTISYYVCAGDLFRLEARSRPKMREKYLFMKDRLFNGREYKCEIDNCLTLVPPPTPCANNGCASCRSIGAACTTVCNDCPKLAGCAPGMDCNQCYKGHPSCKYWTCKDSKCAINAW